MSNNRFEELAAKSMGLEVEEVETTEKVETTEQTTQDTKKESTEKVTQETKPEESSLKEDSTQEQSADTKDSKESFEDLLVEKTKGKYKTYEDIEEALSSKAESVNFANEQMEKLNDYVAKGGDVNEYLRTQIANYDEMDELQAVRAHMKFKNQDLESDEVDLLFNNEYKLSEDEYTKDEIRLSNIKLKQDAKKAKEELKKFQETHSVPQSHRNSVAEKAKIEENLKVWSEKVDNSLTDFKDVSFDINDKGEKFSYNLSEEDVNNIRTSNKNLPKFWNRYVNEDGSENISRLNRDMAALENLDSIVRSAFAQGLSKGKGDIIDDIKNPSYTPDSKTSSNKPLSIQEQIDTELRKNM